MYVKVRVTPKAKKETVNRVSNTELAVTVREPAEQNLANRRVREIVSEVYEISLGKVRMISGHRSVSKMFDVEL